MSWVKSALINANKEQQKHPRTDASVSSSGAAARREAMRSLKTERRCTSAAASLWILTSSALDKAEAEAEATQDDAEEAGGAAWLIGALTRSPSSTLMYSSAAASSANRTPCGAAAERLAASENRDCRENV